MAEPRKLKIVLSDENRLFREGLKRILANRKTEIIGEFSSLAEAAEGLREAEGKVDLILCDPSADATREFEAIREITRQFASTDIILLTEQLNPRWLNLAVDAGASGFLPKDISAAALRCSIDLVRLGERIFPTMFHLLGPKAEPEPQSEEPEGSLSAPLSSRETQVLGRLANGLPNKTIATDLGMAEATVKVHIKALMRKLNVQNRTQAALWARSHAFQDRGQRRLSFSAINGT
jgi:two-component system nitrate/nitrite response regulator NarL